MPFSRIFAIHFNNSQASVVSQLVNNLIYLQYRRPRFNSWVGNIPWKRDRILTPVFLGFPDDSDWKESACNVGDLGSITGLRRAPGKGNGNPIWYSCLENPHGQRNLEGYFPWGCKESDMTEWLSQKHTTTLRWLYHQWSVNFVLWFQWKEQIWDSISLIPRI